MLRQILAFSLQFRSLVVVLAAALMVFGVSRLRDVPVDVLPEFKAPMVEIQAEARRKRRRQLGRSFPERVRLRREEDQVRRLW